jgi:hypothetical protein
MKKNSTACSAIALCMRWEKSAAGIAGITKKATRSAKNAPFLIIRTITARS